LAARKAPTHPLPDASGGASLRLFVAIDLDAEVLARVARVIDEQKVVMPHARWQAPHQLHVTLSFLGQVEQASFLEVGARVLESARRFPPFNVSIGAAGGFPNARRPAVVWLGVEPDARSLFGIAAELEAAWKEMGRSVDARAYHPHLTLARSKARAGDARLASVIESLAGVELGSCDVREIVLYRSDSSPAGVQYTAVLRAPLGGE
jgi:RNA 2',3'-cyclic 3'-phosphodiesterase